MPNSLRDAIEREKESWGTDKSPIFCDSGTESYMKIKNLHPLRSKCRFCQLFVCFVQFGARHHFFYRWMRDR